VPPIGFTQSSTLSNQASPALILVAQGQSGSKLAFDGATFSSFAGNPNNATARVLACPVNSNCSTFSELSLPIDLALDRVMPRTRAAADGMSLYLKVAGGTSLRYSVGVMFHVEH
jgi:hypothetical protein